MPEAEIADAGCNLQPPPADLDGVGRIDNRVEDAEIGIGATGSALQIGLSARWTGCAPPPARHRGDVRAAQGPPPLVFSASAIARAASRPASRRSIDRLAFADIAGPAPPIRRGCAWSPMRKARWPRSCRKTRMFDRRIDRCDHSFGFGTMRLRLVAAPRIEMQAADFFAISLLRRSDRLGCGGLQALADNGSRRRRVCGPFTCRN